MKVTRRRGRSRGETAVWLLSAVGPAALFFGWPGAEVRGSTLVMAVVVWLLVVPLLLGIGRMIGRLIHLRRPSLPLAPRAWVRAPRLSLARPVR